MARKSVAFNPEIIQLENDFIDIRRVKEIIEENIEDIAWTLLEKFEDTVSLWETEVIFDMDIEKEGAAVYTTNEVYGYVNEGTEPHAIAPLTASVMAYPAGSAAGGIRSKGPSIPKAPKALRGRGALKQNIGDTMFSQSVFHPGTEGKKFTEKITEETVDYIDKWKDWFEELSEGE